MKKRMISSILTLCIAVSLVLPVYAADNSVSSKIDQDMEAMRNAFLTSKQSLLTPSIMASLHTPTKSQTT